MAERYAEYSQMPWRVNLPRDDPEYPDAYVQKELRPWLESRWPRVRVVQTPAEAELVIWAVWDFALCRAANASMLEWERLKGRLSCSCAAHRGLLPSRP